MLCVCSEIHAKKQKYTVWPERGFYSKVSGTTEIVHWVLKG